MENLQTVSVNPVAHCTSFLCYYKNEMAESRLYSSGQLHFETAEG